MPLRPAGRRLRRAYHTRGPAALIHGNRGRPSPRRLDEGLRQQIIMLARTTYVGVNYQHLTELLAERDGLQISRTSLRRVLGTAGVRSPRRRRPPRHRRRRERRVNPHGPQSVQAIRNQKRKQAIRSSAGETGP